MKPPKQYAGVADVFHGYWRAYGGFATLKGSPYLHVALLLLLPTVSIWADASFFQTDKEHIGWWDQSISVLPNLLGFTLGGFAMFVGFGDEKFRQLLAEPGPDSSVNDYVQACAIFVHFILIQASALAFAIVSKGLYFYTPIMDPVRHLLPALNTIGGAVGYGLFLYSIALVLAATMHLFRLARLYALFQAAGKP